MKDIMTTLPKKDNPCVYCSSRKIGCHGRCDRYKDFKIKMNDLRTKEKMYTRSTSSRSDQIHGAYSISKKQRKNVIKVIQKIKF